ncbi:bifunctional polynucleotide phosphatase/kinase [Lingula anatina]|uniref:Bifunctional polynucleotide phosphatase/kinase n=1 Tax=Lingula anatina TaxID=7574 RepID=A0A1S3HST4_LINAN|nr:bifunctional polynucleotide phosphatase/kinase [Lingula anatina]|eukprot:XP_013389083.1 bifunctional polynucleotide phosphatase/kinase [Lingula anatina]
MWSLGRAVDRSLPSFLFSFRSYSTANRLKYRYSTAMASKCYLVCKQSSHEPVPLPDKVPVSIGRGPVMKIKDTKCSRNQLELTADHSKSVVKVKQIGPNPSSIGENEDILAKNEEAVIRDGDILHVIKGKYPHFIKFEGGDSTKSGLNEQENAKIEKQTNKKSKSIADYFSKDKSDGSNVTRKRKLDEGGSYEGCKRLKSDDSETVSTKDNENVTSHNDLSDEDDDEEKEIKKKLQMMKETFQKMSSPDPSVSASLNSGPVPLGFGSHDNQKHGKATSEARWESKEKLMIYTGKGVRPSSKIAGFDLDGTIITTNSGRVFPINIGDWKILYPEVPGKLKKLLADGFKVVFFTNQSGISKGKMTEQEFQRKVENITSKLNIPVQVFVSTGSGLYRKPSLGVWNVLLSENNDGIEVDPKQSFYVGDAAGRPENKDKKKKKDFSCGDRLFALNIGIRFYTPEEYFLGHKPAPFNMPEFDPRDLKSDVTLLTPSTANITFGKQEVILMVGVPACGKSTFVKQYLVPEDYIHVNRDTLGTWQKCVQVCEKSLKEGKSVAVDNTNPDKETRKRYVDCAKKAGVPCRCFVFTASFNHCRHNERFRELTDSKHQHINDMVFNSFKSKFQEPIKEEGFSEIVKVNFVPKFKNKHQEKKYKQFLLEK